MELLELGGSWVMKKEAVRRRIDVALVVVETVKKISMACQKKVTKSLHRILAKEGCPAQ